MPKDQVIGETDFSIIDEKDLDKEINIEEKTIKENLKDIGIYDGLTDEEKEAIKGS